MIMKAIANIKRKADTSTPNIFAIIIEEVKNMTGKNAVTGTQQFVATKLGVQEICIVSSFS